MTDFSGLQAFQTPGGVGANNLSSFQNPAGASTNNFFPNGGFGFFVPGPGQQSSGGGAPQNPQPFQLPANRLSSFAPPPSSSGEGGFGPDDQEQQDEIGNMSVPGFGLSDAIQNMASLTNPFGFANMMAGALVDPTSKTPSLTGFAQEQLGIPTLSDIANDLFGRDPGVFGDLDDAPPGTPTDAAGNVDLEGAAFGGGNTGYSNPGGVGGDDSGSGSDDTGQGGGESDGGADTGDGQGQPGDDYAYGGEVTGPGGPRDDAVPANLSAGEYVVDAQTVQAMGGPETFERMQEQGQGFAGQPGGGVPQDAMQGGAPGQSQLGPNGMQPEEDPEEKKMRMREGLLAHAQNLLSQCM